MPNSNNQTTEAELSEFVLTILRGQPGGEATIEFLIGAIRKMGVITADDQTPSGTREGEEIWEQRVRNIRSHAASENNYINQGYLEGITNGYRITPAGRAKP